MTFGAVSGGHFNPAVTLAAAMLKRIDPVDAVVYILAQLSGAVLGALLVKGLLLDEGRAAQLRRRLEVSRLLAGNFAGSVVEALGTFMLVLAILAVALNPRAWQDWAPLAIGLTFGFAVMIFGPLTGACFNPARWFGPALIGDDWGGVWPYLVGPLVGADARGRRLPVRDRRARSTPRAPSRRTAVASRGRDQAAEAATRSLGLPLAAAPGKVRSAGRLEPRRR